MSELALVTGATGFIGSHLVDGLLSDGVRVRCLVRRAPPFEWIDHERVELVRGDCKDAASLTSAVRGVDLVYHVAGVTWAPRADDFYQNNVVGTRNLLDAVSEHAPGLRRFVYVSSQAAAGPTRTPRPRLESDPDDPVTPYGKSKLAAEEELLSRSAKIPTTILRPGAVYGPRDRSFLPIFKLIARKILIQFGSGERLISFCHVSDLVSALMAAGQVATKSGSLYNVAEPVPRMWSEVERIIAAAMDVSPRRLVLGTRLLTVLATLGQFYGIVFSRPVQLNRARLQELLEQDWSLDPTQLQSDLGVNAEYAVDSAMQEVVRWYRRNNWI